ncbi:MAG TPA: FAD-dependent oxidoreductase [Chloroflexota bacterium]|nr:FAD-dependent oxidoreductase [Chloroflexota bacterium]
MTGSDQTYDVVVIGGGLAGLTAGLFAARYGRSVIVLESTVPGGHLVNVEKIEDFPGLPDGIAGYDLAPTVQEQAERAGAQFQLAEVTALEPPAPTTAGEPAIPMWRVVTTDSTLVAQAVILASGTTPQPLGVPGEESLTGRGVSHCATCDGPLFRDRPVAVAGGGTYALQEALTLSAYASSVLILNPDPASTAQATYQQRVAQDPKIELRHSYAIEEVVGERSVAALRLRDLASNTPSTVEVAALFVYAGSTPNTALVKDLFALTPTGHVPTDVTLATPLPGLFAAGDVRQHSPNHALTSAADGATAAISAHHYLASLG